MTTVPGPGVRKFWRRMQRHPRTVGAREAESAVYAIAVSLVVFFEKLNALRAQEGTDDGEHVRGRSPADGR